jgi:aspartyl-tRNA(Asn)/glutamyl-tRNA(Gln) amidotransferase subunit C
MSSLDQATVARIAHLARIRLDEGEAEGYAQELARILDFVEQLSAVDTEGVEPMTAVVPHTLRLRGDEVTDGKIAEDVLANAPERVSGFYAVPKVVE